MASETIGVDCIELPAENVRDVLEQALTDGETDGDRTVYRSGDVIAFGDGWEDPDGYIGAVDGTMSDHTDLRRIKERADEALAPDKEFTRIDNDVAASVYVSEDGETVRLGEGDRTVTAPAGAVRDAVKDIMRVGNSVESVDVADDFTISYSGLAPWAQSINVKFATTGYEQKIPAATVWKTLQ